MLSLGPNQLSVFKKASAAAIVTAFGRLDRYISNHNWIAESNRYRVKTIGNLEIDAAAGAIQQRALVEYIAASAPLHCADGWGFLARALDACERGNSHIAIHLSYYAELRAAMAILATQGIGVFDKKHYVVENASTCHLINGSTHAITWAFLEAWANLAPSGEKLLTLFSVRGKTLWEWLIAYQPSTTIAATVAGTWLKTWGLDLQLLANDQNMRNEASYRPNDLSAHPAFAPASASKLLREFWKLSEPSVLPFDLLDRYLLKIAVQKIFKGANPNTRIRSVQYRSGIRAMLGVLGLTSLESVKMIGFLERSEVPLLVKLAERKPKRGREQYLDVLARSSLMLRVATGFCGQLIAESTINRSSLDFWLNAFGEARGLWSPGARPTSLLELWEGIKDAITEEENWMATRPSNSVSVADWRNGRGEILMPLTECERAMLWSIFP
jgi:hypothetical protein